MSALLCSALCTGVNSDPTRDDEASVTKVVDERRSKGALCASSAVNVHTTLPMFLSGCITPQVRTRIRCVVKRCEEEGRGGSLCAYACVCVHVCVCVYMCVHLQSITVWRENVCL